MKKLLSLLPLLLLAGCAGKAVPHLLNTEKVPLNTAVVIIEVEGEKALNYVQLCATFCRNYRFEAVKNGMVALYVPVSSEEMVFQSYTMTDEVGYVNNPLLGRAETYFGPEPPMEKTFGFTEPGIYFLARLHVDSGRYSYSPEQDELEAFLLRHADKLEGMKRMNFR